MKNTDSFSTTKFNTRLCAAFITLLAALTFMSGKASAQVSVTATAGTVGPTAYTTLGGAFTAINAGTHQGAVTVSITASTSEGATAAVLNSSGAGSAVYTSVLIRPTVDGVTISGASVTGRGIIELNGSDNVTIDGDNPNTGGTNRNLTVQNTAANTITFTSVIRIALATSIVTSADNVTIKNLNLIGNATGRNVAGATSTTGTENSVYAVLATAGASTVSATTAPSAIASVATTIGSPATAANLIIDNNSVSTVARGIAVQGSATTVFPGLTISNNTIGNATASAVDQVYSVGITAQGSANGSIAGNTVYIESFLPSSTSAANRAIDVGGISATGTFTIERNKVNRAKNNAPDFWLAHGINLAGGTNHIVRNNFVIGITLNTTSGGFYSTTFAAAGIRVAGGTGHQIYHNSVNMTGVIPGATDTITAACLITSTTVTGVDVRNNIFANSLTGGSAASAHVGLYLPPSGTSAMNLTLNNNDYFEGPNATNGIAQVGTTPGTTFFKAANFNAGATTPATNLRSYTSTLSAAGTNDNASKVVDPQFLSATDLHIANASPMVDMGANVGVGSDIDGQSRVPPPDIGADEPGGITPVANDIAATAIINPPTGSTRSAGTPFTVQASFTNNGTAAQVNVPVRFKIIDASTAVVYNQTTTIASINPGQTLTATFPNATLTAGAYTTMAIAELVGDQNTANDSVSGTLTVINPLSGGTYTVGTGGNYTSLTNLGGIFDALNVAGATGNITINIISDLTGETGAVALNELAGGITVTIKPSGAARTITGTAANLSLIKLNGADGVTIDGSLSGGTDRSLTMTYGNTGGTVIWIASASASNGANNNTVKNCILSGNTGATIISGVLAGSGTTLGGDADFSNSNNTIQNNAVFRVQNAFFLRGNGTAFDQNWLITGNNLGSNVAADKLLFRGMLLGNAQNFTISNNVISGISSTTTTSSTMSGIQIALLVNGGSITRNKISDIRQNNTAGWGSNGIYFSSSTTTSNVTIANNFVSDVASQGFNGVTSVDNGYGIMIDAGGGYNFYHNTVVLNSNQVSAAGVTAALNIAAAAATVGSIDLRDNILMSTQTVGTRYGVLDSSTAGATVFSTINYNDYFAQNVGFLTSAQPTLANWQTATGQDANSQAVDPVFVSATDFHLQPTSTLVSAGTPIATVTTDIDGDPRPAVNPDIGADELVQTTGGTLPAGTYYNASTGNGDSLGGNVTITGQLTLGGILNTGANTLTIDCNGSILGAGAGNYVVGNLTKNYCGASSFNFAVGTNGANPGYSPVTANVTALGTTPSTLTVKATDGPQPNVNPATSIKRYWTLTEGGNLTADLTFNYLDPQDIMGTEANYRLIRVVGGTSVSFPGSVNTAANTASLSGVSNFSDWTVGETAAPTAAPASILGRITNPDGSPLGGVIVNLGGSLSARTITDANGLYRFENVATGKLYFLRPDRANFSFSPSERTFSLNADMTNAVFTANPASIPTANPLDADLFFVRQQYLDFLGREPDLPGLFYWTAELDKCGTDAHCLSARRIDISAAFFMEAELQQTGSYVYRLYKGALGRRLSYEEFSADRQKVLGGADLEASKKALADEFVKRSEFMEKYSQATGAESFVDTLLASMEQTSGADLSSQRSALIESYNVGASMNQSRALALSKAIDVTAFKEAEYNPTFVLMEYFGYLKRNPEVEGYQFWLNVLENKEPGNYRGMVCSFLTSAEYQQRFSAVTPHSNRECR
jgi:hypothetical protein